MSWRVSGWINTFFEFVLATLPIIAVYKLKIAREQRWHVISLLSLSYCVGLVGLVRIYLSEVLLHTMDFPWLVGPLWVTAEIEVSLSLVSWMSETIPTETDVLILDRYALVLYRSAHFLRISLSHASGHTRSQLYR